MKLLFLRRIKTNRPVLLASFLLFSIICSFVILKSARDSIFLSHYSARKLPYIMALNTLVSALVAALYLRLYKKYPLKPLVSCSFIIFVGAIFLFWLHSAHRHHALASVLYVFVGIIGTLAPVQAWTLISKQFSTREAKNAMGMMGAGATAGAIAGGLISRGLVGAWGNVYILIPAGGVALFCALAASQFFRASRFQEEPKAVETNNQSVISHRLVFFLLAVVALGTIFSTFIDYQFKTLTQYQFQSSQNMAKFFGSFYAITGGITLLLQLLGIPLFLMRFRISTSLPALPFCLFLFNGFLLITGLFAAAVMLRGTEEVLKHSVERSSLEVLYISMPENAKVRVKGLIDTIGVRVPEGIATLLLVLLFTHMHLAMNLLAFFNVGFLALWLFFAYYVGRFEYPSMLMQEIKRKEIDLEKIKENLFTNRFYHFLPEVFQNYKTETVLKVLDLLETTPDRWIGRDLLFPLKHDDPEVRLKTLRILFDQNANLSDQVKRLLQDPDERIRAEAIHYIKLKARKPESILKQLGNDHPLICKIAFHASRKGVLYEETCRQLHRLLDDTVHQNPAGAQQEVAHVLQFMRPNECASSLYKKLLSAESDEVRKATLKSISQTKPPGMISTLLALSRDPLIHTEVIKALTSYGKQTIPNLARIVDDEQGTIGKKKLALKIAAEIGGRDAFHLMVRSAQHENLSVRFIAIKAMNRMKDQPLPDEFRPVLNQLLEQELASLEYEWKRAVAASSPPHSMMNKVISQRIFWAFERVFLLLSILHRSDALYYAYHGWISHDPKQRDTALELLEQSIEPELRERIHPLVETLALEESDQQQEIRDQKDPAEREKALESYLREKEPLLVAAAIWDLDEARELPSSDLKDVLRRTSHPLIQEAFNRRNRNMERASTEENVAITTIQKMEILSKIDIFSKLGSQELLLMADQAIQTNFEPDEILFQEGDPANDFYCIVAGQVELSRSSKKVKTAGAGESIGLNELLTNQPRMFTAKSISQCVCLRISHDGFWEILEDYSSVCRGVIEVLVQQIDSLSNRVAQNSERDKS